jgi:hypothetical protein
MLGLPAGTAVPLLPLLLPYLVLFYSSSQLKLQRSRSIALSILGSVFPNDLPKTGLAHLPTL